MGIFKTILRHGAKSKETIVALDMGEGFVKALLVEIDDKENRGIIIGEGKSSEKPDSIKSGAIADISRVLETCKEAIGKACDNTANAAPNKIVIGISGGNTKSIVTNVHYKRLRPEKEITEQEIKDIMKEVKGRAINKAKENFVLASGCSNIETRLLNATIAEIRIDGYKVQTPFGFQGKDINLRILNVYAPSLYIKIINAIAFELQFNLSGIFSIPFTVAEICNYLNGGFNGILVDVGYEITAVSVIQNGSSAGTKIFSLGGASFTKAIAKDLDIDFISAEKLKIKYSERKLSGDLEIKVNAAIKKILSFWRKGVELVLSDFSVTELLPNKIYLTGGGSILPDISKSLDSGNLSKNLPIMEYPDIGFLNFSSGAQNIFSNGFANSPDYNGAISLVSFLLNCQNDKHIVDKILWKEIKEV